MHPGWYIRLTLLAMVLVPLGAAGLGFDAGSVVRVALLALAVALVSLLIAYLLAPELVGYGLSVTWLAVSVLAVERAIALGLNGWIAVGVWLLISVLAVSVYGLTFKAGRMRAASEEHRERAIAEHNRLVDERRSFAQRAGLRYEDAVPELADGFGRLDQQVPDDFVDAEARLAPGVGALAREAPQVERGRIVLEHAANLRAEAVVHAEVAGVPVVVFDVDVLNHDVLLDPDQIGHVSDYDVAAALARAYLTVWTVPLPVALPYVASAYAVEQARLDAMQGARVPTADTEAVELRDAWQLDVRTGVSTWVRDESSWSSGNDDQMHPDLSLLTENAEFAKRLMSVPEMRASALATQVPPFVVDGDRLVASVLTTHGVGASDVERGISFLASLARSVPWHELEVYRADPADDRMSRFYRTYRHGQSGVALERWVLATTTRSGLRMYERTAVAIWSRPFEGDEVTR